MGTSGGTSGGGTTYKVTVEATENGTVSANPSADVAEGAVVTLEIEPKTAGYALDTLTVKDTDGNVVSTKEVTAGAKYTFKMPASNVKVSATFKAARLGTKASPDAVGDIVFSDGSAVPYTADLTDAQKQAAVAVIFDATATKMLGVGLVQEPNKVWAVNGTAGYTTNIGTLAATKDTGSTPVDAVFLGDGANDGSGSLAKFRIAVGATGPLSLTDYSAWAFVESYATTAGLKGTYADGWYMPSIAELCKLYQGVTNGNVNNALEKIGATQMSISSAYWSSSQYGNSDNNAWGVRFATGDLTFGSKSEATKSVCVVRPF